MITACISGPNGFIASNLIRHLRALEISAIPIPRTLLYAPTELTIFMRSVNPDYILHTAAHGNMASQSDEEQIFGANLVALHNLLQASKDIDYKLFVNFSSSSVKLDHQTMYSATKRGGELLAQAFYIKYQKPIVSIRPYTVFGKGEQPEHLIPKLIESCKTRIQIPFVSYPVHDYIGIDDFCRAVCLLIEKHESAQGRIVDIGTGVMTTNQEILQIVEKVTGGTANIEEVAELRKYDSSNWVADSWLLDSLKWKPKDSTEDVIRRMI